MLSRSFRHWILLLVILCRAAPASRSAPPPSPPIYKFDEVETKPAPKKPVRVYFPRSIRRKGEAVTIELRFVVKTDGRLDQLTIVKFSDPGMIEPAMEAYSGARFTPGIKDGKPVNTWMEVTESAPPL